MSPSQNWFESDDDYRARVAKEAGERTIENSTGSAPTQGWFESNDSYRDRITREANERRIENSTDSAPSQGWFESDDSYRGRIEREANESTMNSSTGSTPTQGWFESDGAYETRIRKEANEQVVARGTGSTPTQGWFEGDHAYRSRIAHEAREVRTGDQSIRSASSDSTTSPDHRKSSSSATSFGSRSSSSFGGMFIAIAVAIVIAVGIFSNESKKSTDYAAPPLQQRSIEQGHSTKPGLPGITGYAAGSLNWFEDDLHVESVRHGLVAFRRCSGDRDKPTCVLLIADSAHSRNARIVAADLVRPFENQYPIAFSSTGLLFVTPPNIYSYDLDHHSIRTVAEDAWTPGLSPDGRTLAYLTTFRSGGANVQLLDLQSGNRKQVTNFQGKTPGGQFIRWLPEGDTLVFELQDDRTHDIETWSVRVDGRELRKVADGQVFDISPVR